ncbi:MAG: hypothetical protein UV64_C0003G0028 [Parcubacteria group bacterium GW2011_GWC1_43_11b]|nr:MAG: hypothetical protein UV64_C0003G0028 [Parcubacteria group bacterium GW2011_GWC1_43_11b]
MKKYLIGVILLVLVAGGAYYWGLNKKENNINQESAVTQEQEVVIPVSENRVNNSGWKKYSDNSIEFEYPDNIISVMKSGDKVSLNHFLNYRHNDFCDMKGTGTVLEKFTDFNVSFRIISKDIKGALDETQEWLAKDYFANGTFKLSPGFVDSFMAGYTYYFSISSTKTLVVVRTFVPELNSINADNKTYLNLPGVIIPDKERELFTKILSSLKVK